MTKVIAFVGRKGSGKDTAYAALEHDNIKNVKFADALKDMLDVILRMRGLDSVTIERMLNGDLKEIPSPALEGKTPRHAMQTLGTEWGRVMIGNDLWVNTVIDRIKHHINRGRRVVVTDARFKNEIAALKDNFGAFVYKVERPAQGAGIDSHVSETGIDELAYDRLINNEGTLHRFIDEVQREVFQNVWR